MRQKHEVRLSLDEAKSVERTLAALWERRAHDIPPDLCQDVGFCGAVSVSRWFSQTRPTPPGPSGAGSHSPVPGFPPPAEMSATSAERRLESIGGDWGRRNEKNCLRREIVLNFRL